MEFDIENDMTIDRYNLDKECLTMASTYFKYADEVRKAKTLSSEKADYVKVILAERSIAIRENASQTGQKLTEGLVTSMLDCDEEVIEARKEWREAEATYNRLNVALSALEIKKSELDNLVKLYCNSMYVNTSSKGDKNLENDLQSDYNRKSMNPLPN